MLQGIPVRQTIHMNKGLFTRNLTVTVSVKVTLKVQFANMMTDTLMGKMGYTHILSDKVSVKQIKGVCFGVGQCEYIINTAFSNLSEVKRRRGNSHSVHEIRKNLFICGRKAHFLCIKCVTQPFSFGIGSTISTHTFAK